jgi:hypothetical protein
MRDIFVFGSNLAGRHGAGSALEAVRSYGAKYGQGFGFQGSSYAIPTKDRNLKVLPLREIERFVYEFRTFARATRDIYRFNVVAIGCGLAGYEPKDIAPFFRAVSDNVNLPEEFKPFV